MITKFRLYEKLNIGVPKVGDYVIIDSRKMFEDDNIVNFTDISIGYIWKSPDSYNYLVKFYNIPKEQKLYFQFSDYEEGLKIGNSLLVPQSKIKWWSENKDELQYIIDSKKYNM